MQPTGQPGNAPQQPGYPGMHHNQHPLSHYPHQQMQQPGYSVGHNPQQGGYGQVAQFHGTHPQQQSHGMGFPSHPTSGGNQQHPSTGPHSTHPSSGGSGGALYERVVTPAPGGGPPTCSLAKKDELCLLLQQVLHHVRHLRKDLVGLDQVNNVSQVKIVTEGIKESIQKLQDYFALLVSGEYIRIRPHFLSLVPITGLQMCHRKNEDEWKIPGKSLPYWEEFLAYHNWTQGGLKAYTSIRDQSKHANIRASIRFSSTASLRTLPLAPPMAPFDANVILTLAQQSPEFAVLNLRVLRRLRNSGVVEATINNTLRCLMHFSGWRMDHVIIRSFHERNSRGPQPSTLPVSLRLASSFTVHTTALDQRPPQTPLSEHVDLFSPSELVTFRQLTQVATAHLLSLYTFEDVEEDMANKPLRVNSSSSSADFRLRKFLLWLSNYRALFNQRCQRCYRLFDSSWLLPLYRDLEDSKDCWHMKCRL